MIYELKKLDKAQAIFEGWQESLIWSCLQGTMGRIYVDSLKQPKSAMAMLGDFCYFAGEPSLELVSYKPENVTSDFIIMVPENEAWQPLIEGYYKDGAKKITRYAIKKEMDPSIFNKKKLEEAVNSLSEEYTITMVDEQLFYQLKETPWAIDFVSQFDTYEMYRNNGLGVMILKDDEIVAGASSYSYFNNGIEVEMVTKEEYRQKGLAYVSASKIILECLKRNWYPSWDARTKISVSLAEKLGYHFSHKYVAYDILNY